ncbi:MAG: cytochrome c biogenesis protein CcdA [Mycobacterium sp.]|nr:cytochrome c biogenesis protein CcdA [Mycobacterium sp.]
MNSDLVGLAFAAGMVAAFNPCGFAMLPAYLTLVVQRDSVGRPAAVARALAATAAMALGFLAVFGAFGALTVSLASTVARYMPYVTLVVGAVLLALGVWLLTGRELAVSWNRLAGNGRWAPTSRLGSMFGYGVGYAIASLSCTVGPFLAVTGSSLRSGSPLTAIAVYAAYAAGIALVVGVLAVAVALASTGTVDRMRRILPYVNRISGVILVVVGLYVAYYGWFEVRLFAGGSAQDPVIGAAGRIQRTLAGWVYTHGAWPWLVALAVLVTLALTAVVRQRRRSEGIR